MYLNKCVTLFDQYTKLLSEDSKQALTVAVFDTFVIYGLRFRWRVHDDS